jgi:hypothetical protein
MRYTQLGKFDANHLAHEVQRVLDAWLAASGGQRTLRMAVILPTTIASTITGSYWSTPRSRRR